MQCKKCGTPILDTEKFCTNCGEPVTEISNQQQFIQTPPTSNQQNFIQTPPISNNINYKKKSSAPKVIAIIGGILGGFVIIFLVIFFFVSANSDKLICKSDEGNITIMYNKNGLTGYTTAGMSYDFDEQKEYAKKIGVDAYTKEFSQWFSTHTSGTCTIDGKKVEQTSNTDNNDNNNSNSNTTNDKKVVGDDKYGYISVPSNWNRFYDVDGNNSLQYSYGNLYIVSLNTLDATRTAKEYASNYMYNKQNSSEVTGVTGATVTIGKNKEYTAYQVYMYYPSDSTYLVTYWFEAGDGKVHYIALEGPQELDGVKITDYLYIPESFSLKK